MRRALAFLKRSLALLGVGVVVASGCYKSGDGPDPVDDQPYYPVGIALSPSGRFLFLTNSNFDLKYNAGTLQALDTDLIWNGVPGVQPSPPTVSVAVAAATVLGAKECRNQLDAWRAEADLASQRGLKVPTRPDCDRGSDASKFMKADVRIGAFAADVTVVPRQGKDPSTGARLLVPVRGDASLTVVDFEESGSNLTLRCSPGAKANSFGQRCAPAWRLTGFGGAGAASRELTLGGDPFAVATISSVPKAHPENASEPTVTGIAAVAHQTSGDVSLFIDTEKDNGENPPDAKLVYTLTGLPGGATSLAALTVPGVTEARFLAANRTQSVVSTLQYFPDPFPQRSGLVLAGYTALTPQAGGSDSRGIVVDPPNPGELRATRVFVTNRTPASIVLGQVDARGVLSFYDNVALPVGPSRIIRAVIDGKTLILAVSFDARALVVFDPDTRRVSNSVLTHRGPYALAVDSNRKVAYIANFTDSTIEVFNLDPAFSQNMIYSVGIPSGPRS